MKPIAYLRELEGKSNAHLITFDDGKDYVVKCIQSHNLKILTNEWVTYCLARFLGLPIPFAKIVEIPQEFYSDIPEFSQCVSTFQFASLYIPDCFNAHQVNNIHQIINHQSLASIILLDYWIGNRDRTRKNILLHEEMPNAYRLWIIDHAEAFGSYNWEQSDLEEIPAMIIKSATHQLMASFIKDEKYFTQALELIQQIPSHLLEEIVAVIPDEWMILEEEKQAMVTLLVNSRKKILPKLMKKFIKQVYKPIRESNQ